MPDAESAYIGEIAMHGFGHAPVGWAYCNGAVMPIAQNQAMFSLIGSLYGGNGRETYALPNLNSRSPVGATISGGAPGLAPYDIGDMLGAEGSVLAPSQLPRHSHIATFSAAVQREYAVDAQSYISGADKPVPEMADLLAASADLRFRSPGGFGEPDTVQIGAFTAISGDLIGGTVTLAAAGTAAPFPRRSPVTAVNFCICEAGIYPPRS